MSDLERRINSCIDHINTAVDVDPWAQELATKALTRLLDETRRESKKSTVYSDVPDISGWIPCHVINQSYIPELKDVGYAGILFTYKTRTGKQLVKINWIERGKIVGKGMNGTPVAYMPLPEPYAERQEGMTKDEFNKQTG